MSISFKLIEDKDSDGDEALYFEVKSDALVVARANVTDWDDRWEISRALSRISDEMDEWGVEY